MARNQTTSASRGRPRDAGRDSAILAATLRVLTQRGYDQLSIEAVAAAAGVGKTTIYRRYPDKAALVLAAVETRSAEAPPAGGRGGLRARVLESVRWLARGIAEQEIGLLGAVFAGMRSDPALAAGIRRIRHRDQAAMTAPFADERAAALFAEVAPAMIVHRLVVTGEPCDEPFLAHLVDDILLPLLRTKRAKS